MLEGRNESSRLAKAADATRDAVDRARGSLAAGAGTAAEFTKTVASEARERANKVARVVREAERDTELQHTASSTTERAVDKAGSAVSGAAPAVGRGAEYAVEKVGAALRFAARPIATIVGAIAGTVGGWWKKAAELKRDLPAAEEQECRAHFATVTPIPGIGFDQARSGYAIGYVAGCNPEYLGRSFEQIEPDLRHGFRDGEEYESLRDFARFGYTRGARTLG